MLSNDLEARLWLDPGQRTLGQLLQERTAAALEIKRLKHELVKAQEWRRGATTPNRAPPADGNAHARPQAVLLRLNEVSHLVGLSRTSIYQRIKEGTFPAPLRLGDRCVRWARTAVDAWRDALEPAAAVLSREKY